MKPIFYLLTLQICLFEKQKSLNLFQGLNPIKRIQYFYVIAFITHLSIFPVRKQLIKKNHCSVILQYFAFYRIETRFDFSINDLSDVYQTVIYNNDSPSSSCKVDDNECQKYPFVFKTDSLL